MARHSTLTATHGLHMMNTQRGACTGRLRWKVKCGRASRQIRHQRNHFATRLRRVELAKPVVVLENRQPTFVDGVAQPGRYLLPVRIAYSYVVVAHRLRLGEDLVAIIIEPPAVAVSRSCRRVRIH